MKDVSLLLEEEPAVGPEDDLNKLSAQKRNRMQIERMSKKVSNKNFSQILGKEVTDELLIKAAKIFDSVKVRRPWMMSGGK